ncbi:unnamed protein product [Penicillium pancosmium]
MQESTPKRSEEFVEDVSSPNTNTSSQGYVPLWHSLKKWPKVVGYNLALSSAILLYGYDLVIVANVSSMPAFQHRFGAELNGKYIIPSEWLSLWNAASPIGMMVGAIIGGYYQDRGGRRLSLATGSFLSAVAGVVIYLCDLHPDMDSRRGLFLTGKLLQGVTIGMLLCMIQTYMSEVLPIVLRGPIIAFLPIFTLLGQLIGSIVVYTSLKHPGAESYRICFASQWAFSAAPFFLSWILPESPTWLLRRGQFEKALKMQCKLDTGDMDSAKTIEDLQTSIKAEEEERATQTYSDCFKGPANRRRTFIVCFASALPQFFGLQLLASASYFMQMVGMSATNSLIFLILGIGLGLIANGVSLFTLNALGRRILILWTLGAAFVLWLALGIAGCFTGVVTIWYTAVSMMVITMVCGLGIWPASHVVAAETSELTLRSKSQGVGWFVSGVATGVFSIILPYIYNPDSGNLRGKTGFVMAAFAAIGYIITWFTIPEMKDRSPMEIDRMFALNLPTRDFKTWKSDVVLDRGANVLKQTTEA